MEAIPIMLPRLLALCVTIILTLYLCLGCEANAKKEDPQEVIREEVFQEKVVEQVSHVESKSKTGNVVIKMFDQTENNPAKIEIVLDKGIKLHPREKTFAAQLPFFIKNEWNPITVNIVGEAEYPAWFYLPEEDGESVSVLIKDDAVAIISNYIEGGWVVYERKKL